MKRVDWKDGLRLDSEILIHSDVATAKNSNTSIFLPHNLRKGISSFVIDDESLQSGLISIKSLEMFLYDKSFVSLNDGYPLSLQVPLDETEMIVNVFLNVDEVSKEIDGVQYVVEHLTLSTEYSHVSKHSIEIAAFRINNISLEPIETDYPILSMNHYLMNSVFSKLERLVSCMEVYSKFTFSISNPLASIYLSFLIKKLQHELELANNNKSNVSPLSLFQCVHDIYIVITDNIPESNFANIQYNFDKAYTSLITLLEEVTPLSERKSIKNFVQFHKHGQKYICDNFPKEFFTAYKHFLVIKKKPGLDIKTSLTKDIKITSISRYTNIIVLSLPGLRIKGIDHSMHRNLHISLDKDDYLYEIEKNSEWDFILVDKSATFSYVRESENYDFFIAFL